LPQRYIIPLKIDTKNVGGKARGLQLLLRKGLLIPDTHVCISDAYLRWKESPKVLDNIKEELSVIIQEEKKYIIRSSASLEDSSEHSFAGQFKTFPNIVGIDGILNSIQLVWESARSPIREAYASKKGIKTDPKLAVIIQEMLEPRYSGVVFTKNPISGKDEIIIEAIVGSSKKILQEGLNPKRWIYRWHKFITKPEKSSIDEKVIIKIAQISKKIENDLGFPLDLEWIYYEDKIWWIQLREITTIDKQDFYSNRISSEYLPGIIKPLIWSINIPLVCGAWIKIIEEMVGPTSLKPSDMAKQFYYRSYFNISNFGKNLEKLGLPRDSLELLMQRDIDLSIRPKPPIGMYPSLIKFIIEKIFFEKRLEKHLNESYSIINLYYNSNPTDLKAILSTIENLYEYNQNAAYYLIISQLLHSIFRFLLEKNNEEKSVCAQLEPEIPSINPNYSISKLASKINLDIKENLTLKKILDNECILEKYQKLMKQFGHLSESGNDFSKPTWSEIPEYVLSLIEYQIKTPKEPRKLETPESRTSWKYTKVTKLYRLKEKISFNYAKSYGLFRKYFLEIGKIFVNIGLIEEDSDIFYLEYEKIKELVHVYSNESIKEKILEIKQNIQDVENIELPSEIYGNDPPPVLQKESMTSKYLGIPASEGYYKGKIKHVKTVFEFDKVKQDQILVIPFSDISWLPILSKAGAIISQSGGILSHAAVIAREYKIPSIFGVMNAYNIPDGSIAIVNGNTGVITVIESMLMAE
jgi:pyruvate,water dikinase